MVNLVLGFFLFYFACIKRGGAPHWCKGPPNRCHPSSYKPCPTHDDRYGGREALEGLCHALAMLLGTTWAGHEHGNHRGLGGAAMELGLIDLVAEHCRSVESPAEIVSISRGKAVRASKELCAARMMMRRMSVTTIT